jgi:hypothetical protein
MANSLETRVRKILERRGFTVLQNGWPDFLCYKIESFDNTSQAFCVEAKDGCGVVSESQRHSHEVLKWLGIPVYVVRREDMLATALADKKCTLFMATDLRTAIRRIGDLEELIAKSTKELNRLKALISEMSFAYDEPSCNAAPFLKLPVDLVKWQAESGLLPGGPI